MKRFVRPLLFALLACAALFARQAWAGPASPEQLLHNMYRFDISCRALQADPDKKVCGDQRTKAYLEFLEYYSDKKYKALIKDEAKQSKERLKKLEALKNTKSIPESKLKRIKSLAQKVQDGDAAAAHELQAMGLDAAPALVALRSARGVLPSKLAQQTLDAVTDGYHGEAGPDLSASMRDAAMQREEQYQFTLKRIALVLQGPERPTPAWLVYAYMFGLGFIPFAAGLAASVICLGRFDAKTFALLFVCYLAYALPYAWFMFRAPFV
jgi:hypothetical protein